MEYITKNRECANRVQDYLIPGIHKFDGLFSNGTLIALVDDKSTVLKRYGNRDDLCIFPIYYKKVCPLNNISEVMRKFKEILEEHDANGDGTIGWLECMFLLLMQNPHVLATYPSLRESFDAKVKDFGKSLNGRFRGKFHHSTIILDIAPVFMRNITTKFAPLPIKSDYRLRPRKRINYAE